MGKSCSNCCDANLDQRKEHRIGEPPIDMNQQKYNVHRGPVKSGKSANIDIDYNVDDDLNKTSPGKQISLKKPIQKVDITDKTIE